jgi:hypothetical protein
LGSTSGFNWMTMTTTANPTLEYCPECGVSEGNLHKYGCKLEPCPRCKYFLMFCDCLFEQLPPGDQTPLIQRREILTPGNPDHFRVETRERIRCITSPPMCCKCGRFVLEYFFVPDEEWRHYIQPYMRRSVLCRECYDYIKERIDSGLEPASS